MSSHEHLWKKGFSKPNSTPVPNPFKIQRRRAKVLSPTLSPQEKLQLKQQADQISQLGYNSQKIPIQAPAPTAEASPIQSKAGEITKQQPTTDAVEIQADASEVQDETKEPDDLAFAEASDASAADSSIQRQEIPDSEAEAIPESDTDNIDNPEEETEIQAKAKQPARNFLELPINAPGTSPSSIQRQGNLGELGNSIQQQPIETEEKVEPEAEQEAQESDETIQRQEIPEAEADEISSSESQTVQRQGEPSDTPAQQTEQSEEYHNFLEIPVNVPGTPSSSIPRQVNLGRLSNQVVQPIKPTPNPGLNRLNTFKSQRIESPVKPVNPVLNQSSAQTVQRQDNTEDEDIQNQPLQESEEETVQKKETQSQSSDATATPSLEQSIQQKRGSGQILSENVRQPMEQAFGADFSQVKVHTDSESDKLNKSIQAKAFTTGKDIFFKKGEYQPDSKPGQELLAHELTHVVQQNGNQVQAKSVKQVATKNNKLQPKLNLTPTSIAQPKIQRRENPQDEPSSAGVQPQPAQPAPAAPESGGEMTPATPQVDGGGTGTAPETTEPGGMAAAPEMAAGGAPASATEIGTQPGAASDAPKSEAAGGGAASPASPDADPDFQATVKKAKGVAEKEKQHDPAESESKEAQDASEPPSNEVESKAQDKQVQEMEQQPPGEFNAEAFKAAVMDKVNQAAPKTLEDADKFKDNNLLSSVKDGMSNQAKETAEQAAGPVAEKTQEAPDTSGIEPKQVKPLEQPDAGSTPGDIGAAQATPKPKPESEVSAPMQAESQKLDQQMAEADVAPEQLASSNEPQFVQALDAKKGAQQRAVEAPQEYRQQEQGTLNQAQSEAQTTSQTQLQGMHGEREQLLAQVMGRQDETKTKDEQERDKVAKDIDGIYQETKTDVEGILNGLDTEVTNRFKVTADTAKQKFEEYVAPQMEEYKKRYEGVDGWVRWGKDKLFGVPPEVTAFFDEGRNQYLNEIDKGLTDIANYVSEQLNKAKERITEGREEIKEYVAGLPEALKQVGTEAAQDIQTKFDDLEQSVKDKETELVDKLAQQYTENLQQLDAQIKEMKASNQPWFAQAFDAMAGVIDTINKLKNMLQNVLAKAASAIGSIIKDPIGFLGNLVSGVKQGLDNFIANIMNHLQGGLIGWLTGAMGSMGILLPDDIFSLKGIFSLVTQILGMTWDYIRRKAVKLFGEPMVAGMEKSVEIFQIIANQGPMGLWEQVQEQFGDLKETVIEEIKGMLITQVITAGVKWIIGLLNPASAFVKAAMAIYDIVMFFINQGSQVVELVNAVIEAITAIASGAVGGAAKLVENALARSLPVVIGFLASLLGISGLAKKVQGIVKKIRSRIDKAIDKVLKKAKSLFKGKKGKGNKDKKNKENELDERTQEEKEADLGKALKKVEKVMRKDNATPDSVKAKLPDIQSKYKLKSLELVKISNSKYHVEGKVNPEDKTPDISLSDSEADNDKFDKLLYEALKQLGSEHYKGYTKREYSTTDLYNAQEADIRSQRPESQEVAKEFDIRSQRPKPQEEPIDSQKASAQDKEVIEKLKSEKEKEIELLTNKIYQGLARAQIAYSTASMAKYYPSNVFKVGSGNFFVEQAINYYIAPAEEVGEDYDYYDIKSLNQSPKEYIPVPKTHGIPQQSDGFKIGSKNKVGTKYPYRKFDLALAKKKLQEFPESITGDKESTIFLAAMLAEPSRYSVSHITNLLVLTNPDLYDSVNVFDKFSMTQSHSDPTGGSQDAQARATTRLEALKTHYPQVENLLQPDITKKAKSKKRKELLQAGVEQKAIQDVEGLSSAVERLKTDQRIEHEDRPKIVTDRDLAAAKQNTQLMGKLKKEFENNKNIADSQLIIIFKKLITEHLQLK